MRSASSIALCVSFLSTSGCGGPVSSRVVRNQFSTLAGAELSPDDVQVERIISQTSGRAVAEVTVQVAAEYARDPAGHWEIVSVRMADGNWIDVARLDAAVTQMQVADTTEALEILAGGVEAWGRANGTLPRPEGRDSLSNLLHPLFVPTLFREDA